MEGLFPIIRRKRVPLVVADTPPVMVGNGEPVQLVASEPPAVVPMIELPAPAATVPAGGKVRRAKRSP